MKRPVKYIVHKITNKSELERICEKYEGLNFRETYLKIEKSLKKSRFRILRELVDKKWDFDINAISESVLILKCRREKDQELSDFLNAHYVFFSTLKIYFNICFARNTLLECIREESEKTFAPNSENLKKLTEIWESIFDEECPPIPDPKWKNLGYQVICLFY